VLFVVALFGIPALGVHEPVGRQALEEGVQVLVVGPDPARTEPHAQEQAVDPIGLMVSDQSLNQGALDPELVTALFAGEKANLSGWEVDENRQVLADAEQDGAAYACPDVAGQFKQGLEPGLELGEHVHPLGRPTAFLRRDAFLHPRGVTAKVTLLRGEWLHRLLSAHGPPHIEVIVVDLEYRTGSDQLTSLKS